MTDEQLHDLAIYVGTIAIALKLSDWTFKVQARPADEDNAAEVICWYGRKRATLRVAEGFWNELPEEQRHIICHECLHCHLDASDVVVRGLADVLGKAAYEVAENGHRAAMEYATDGIADAVAPHLPLPQWTKAKRKRAT